MSVISFKSFAVTAALGFAAVFSAGAAPANAASPMAVPAIASASHSLATNVDYRGRRHQARPKHRRSACSVQSARSKASRMGIRNARVIHRSKSVQVRGFRHGRQTSVTFSDRRGCPIIR
ncbi:antifreeze protein [Falsochrobactrum sp. TDYN1]|uniref:Antifreeze protein n=1 Tax=Falsochrobactrum tianjinense TaxID=2706015 RepID=A0A949UV61_9HYPH|nr:antifreeze protein [Falsochrobactrum sp. TDYN1]MBV2143971.1 antifreeze protein [Falsochrobactrum sp. TDYN1]